MYEEIANAIKEKFPFPANRDGLQCPLTQVVRFLKECYVGGFADFGESLEDNFVYFGYIECAIARDYFPFFTSDEYVLEIVL